MSRRPVTDRLMERCKSGFIFILFLPVLLCARPLSAADDKTKTATTQQVGGLLFDVDEGVKIEQGPGGSVYLKSNKEYMQEKLKSIDEKLEELGKRLDRVESALSREKEKKNESVKVS